MKRTNVIAKPTPPLPKDVRQYRRYSNAPIDQFRQIPGSNDYETIPSNQGSGLFDFFGRLLDSANIIVPSIWGNQNQWQATALNQQLEAERKTNTILWVVIGLVLALLVFLVIRKTK